MIEYRISGFARLFKPPNPRPSGHLLEKSWRLRSPGQKRGDPTHLAKLPPSRVNLLRHLSGPEFGQSAFGNSRWPLWRYGNGGRERRLAG